MSQKGGKFPVFLSFKSPSDIQRAMISNIVPSSWLKLKLIKFFWWTLTREIVVRWPRHSWVRLNLSFLPTFLKQHWTASSSASVTTKPTCCTVRGTLRKGWGNGKEKKKEKKKRRTCHSLFLATFTLCAPPHNTQHDHNQSLGRQRKKEGMGTRKEVRKVAACRICQRPIEVSVLPFNMWPGWWFTAPLKNFYEKS